MKTSITKSEEGSTSVSTEKPSSVPTVEELLSPRVGVRPPKVRLVTADAGETLAQMETKSVGLIVTSPPVEIHTTDGKTKAIEFDARWIRDARRVAHVVAFTIHQDVLAALWRKNVLSTIPPPDRISVWTIGEQARLGITAESANLLFLYGQGPDVRSFPDVVVAPMGDYHWPPSEMHPSPGSYYLAYHLAEHFKPRSLMDPFMGSGVTLHAGLTSGIEELIGVDKEEKWVEAVRAEIDSRGIPVG